MSAQLYENKTYKEIREYLDTHQEDIVEDASKYIYYLNQLAVIFTFSRKIFYPYEEARNFASFLATNLYLYLRKIYPTKLLSVTGYMSTILKYRIVDYVRLFPTSQRVIHNVDNSPGISVDYSFEERLYQTADDLSRIDFDLTLQGVANLVRRYVYTHAPYTDEKIVSNIYISCLLSMLNILMLNKGSLQYLREHSPSDYKLVLNLERWSRYRELSGVVLYDLGPEFESYIILTIRILKKLIAADLSFSTRATYISSQKMLSPLIIAEVNNQTLDEVLDSQK